MAASNIASFARDLFAKMHNVIIIPMNKLLSSERMDNLNKGSTTAKPSDAFSVTEILGVNALTSLAQSIGKVAHVPLEALIAEVLYTKGNFWYYKFLINPQNVRQSQQKLQNEEEVSDLGIVTTYRNKLQTLNFTGISGSILPVDWMRLLDLTTANFSTGLPVDGITWLARYPKMSAAWLKFRQLETFYQEINGDIAILYDMDLYVGKFVNFNYSHDANNPWVINYDMGFKIYPGLVLHTLTIRDYARFFDALNVRYGRTFVKKFEGKFGI